MLDGVANVEDGRTYDDVDLRVAARVTGIAAIVLGGLRLLSRVASYGMTEATFAAIGPEGFFWVFRVLWIATLAATAVVVGGLIVGWRQGPLLWTPGIGQVALGLVLFWGWWAVSNYVDVWGMRRFDSVDLSDPSNPVNAIYLETIRASEWVNIAVGVVVIVLLVTGGIRLLIRRRSTQ